MGYIDNINISFSYNPLFFYSFLFLILLYTIFIYRYTLPKVGYFVKTFLVFLRSASLILILILIFDPTINISSDIKIEPKSLILLDNSRSISEFADSNQIEKVMEISQNIENELGSNASFFTFGNSISPIENFSDHTFDLNETETELSEIQNALNNFEDISSILVISDGIINQGIDPVYQLSDLNIPVYTIGIGDSTEYDDISIERIKNNSTIYTERESEIEIFIRTEGKTSGTAQLNVFDNDLLFYNEKIEISETGFNRIIIPYTADKEGRHKITVEIDPLPGEINKNNNSQSAIISVLASKKKIGIIAGTPSRDLASIVKSIKKNEDLELVQITALGKAGFYNGYRETNDLMDADVIFLIDFPNIYSNSEFVSEIFSIINSSNKNLFISPGFNSDYGVLDNLLDQVSAEPLKDQSRYSESQVTAQNSISSLLGNNRSTLEKWSELPPVTIPLNNISARGQSDILLRDENNRPVLIANQTGNKKIIILNCNNFWRWKLKPVEKEYMLFDNLILNSIKWLSLKSDDFFTVEVNKDNFNLGEDIYFEANLYDKTFEPIDNENISLEISGENYSGKNIFESKGNGLYELQMKLPKPGIYNFTASVNENGIGIKPVTGSFNVNKLELESIERRMNKKLLMNLAAKTGGKYFELHESDKLISELTSNYEQNIYFEKADNELRLSNFELILFIIVLLFSIEWITRKSMRMI